MTDIAEVLNGSGRWHIGCGNSLEMLKSLPSSCVDAIVTDPPYSSGGQFRGDRMQDTSTKYVQTGTQIQRPDFAGDNRDQRAFEYWCVLWMAEAMRVAKPGAVFCCFTDWRQLPTTTDAIQGGGWVWRGIVPWDKTEGTRPSMGRFAAQCEYIVWSTAGARELHEDVGCLPGIVRAFPKPSEKHHITGKPVDVLRQLVRIAPPRRHSTRPVRGGGIDWGGRTTGGSALHRLRVGRPLRGSVARTTSRDVRQLDHSSAGRETGGTVS
jgi:site-specific DNA-methyltransferase (adenine-specific)